MSKEDQLSICESWEWSSVQITQRSVFRKRIHSCCPITSIISSSTKRHLAFFDVGIEIHWSQRRRGLHMEGGGYLHTMRTHQKMETVPYKDCHTHPLGLLKVCAMSVALWIWGNLRSAQIPLVGLTCRHHQRRWLLKANRQAGNNYWCLLVLDMLSVLTYSKEGSSRVPSLWV